MEHVESLRDKVDGDEPVLGGACAGGDPPGSSLESGVCSASAVDKPVSSMLTASGGQVAKLNAPRFFFDFSTTSLAVGSLPHCRLLHVLPLSERGARHVRRTLDAIGAAPADQGKTEKFSEEANPQRLFLPAPRSTGRPHHALGANPSRLWSATNRHGG